MNKEALQKVKRDEPLTKEDAISLLQTENHSEDFYKLLAAANALSRKEYGEQGYIFAQIGLNAAPCPGRCKFCSLAQQHFMVGERKEKSIKEIIAEVQKIDFSKVYALFLMTTADYPPQKYLKIGQSVRQILPGSTELVANIGDFHVSYATQLKKAGFTGAYHIVRLGEGKDTALSVQSRLQTLDAISEAGLQLYYCVEPIGPEHSYAEIADEMLRARAYHVDVMAAMRRVPVPGTDLASLGMISEMELTKIIAVTRLVTRPRRSMNVHEPMRMPLLAGVNQFYAELGVNPRDTSTATETSRGLCVDSVEEMLLEAGYKTAIL